MLQPNQTENLTDLIEQVLQLASSYGASAAEVSVNKVDGFTTTVRLAEVDSVEYENGHDLDVTVYFGNKQGNASTTDIRSSALQTTVQTACDIAKFTGEDSCNGLAERELLASKIPDLSLYHPWSLTAEAGIELALQCEALARESDRRIINSEGVSVSNYHAHHAYGNSHDFLAEVQATQHSISCALIAKEQEQMEQSYDYSVARDPNELSSIELIASKAAEKTVSLLGARKISTCKVPVLFIPEVARSLLRHFISAINGGRLYRKASFLLDSLNQKIFPEFVQISEDPYLLKGLGSSAFDSDGVVTSKKDFVKQGLLNSYCLDVYSARRLNMTTTGNADGVHNLMIKPGDKQLDELIASLDKGLVVTELMGQGVNLLTGDYSRGARGFWVENGEIQYPVSEITIAGNLRTMFENLAAVGCDVDYRGNIRTGSLLIQEMTIAGS